MHIPKNFFHDKAILFLLTAMTFVGVATSVWILLQLTTGTREAFIVQYRSNLGLNAYQPGGASALVAFMLFCVFVIVFHTIVGIRVYHIRHHFSRAILAFGLLLVTAAGIVSAALLGLH